jgi:uncharacterized protein YjbI with pentapeptide repeats
LIGRQLDGASASEADAQHQTERFLAAIAAKGSGPFSLANAGPDGTTLRLTRIQAAGAVLAPRLDGDVPGWWDPAVGGLRLAGADLAGAHLENADLAGANLKGARLDGIQARSAIFTGCVIEEARFDDADLSGARFANAQAGEASFCGAMMEDAVFDGATLRYAHLDRTLLDGASFAGADLWGASLDGADADDTVFTRATLSEANLSHTNLTGSDFEGANLRKARLVGAKLRRASFKDAKLDGADFEGADLSNAGLARLNLTNCNLRHVRLAGAWLESTRLKIAQIGGAVGEEIAGEYEAAQQSYIVLEQNLKSIGSNDEASWAYKKGRQMGRKHAGQAARHALRARDWLVGLRQGWSWISDVFVEWLCNYGESLSRVIQAFLILIVLFAILYGLTGSLVRTEGAGSEAPVTNVFDLFTYSFLNMMTANPPDIGIKPAGQKFYFFVSLQGALGIILMGLFGFVLGNRLRR